MEWLVVEIEQVLIQQKWSICQAKNGFFLSQAKLKLGQKIPFPFQMGMESEEALYRKMNDSTGSYYKFLKAD